MVVATSGQQTLASIEKSVEQLRDDESQLRKLMEDANSERSKLIEQRFENIRTLAIVRTRTALSDGVIDEADRLSYKVRALLQARSKTIKTLKARLTKSQKKYKQDNADYQTLLLALVKLEDKLDTLAKQARKDLANNKDYKPLLSALEKAHTIYKKAKAKTLQAKEDREKKGRPYRDDPLFTYLWERKYGSHDYKQNALIDWLDGKVAALVGYHDARANYAVLLEIPERLSQHLERLSKKLAEKQERLDVMEADRVRQLAGHDLVKELETARKKQSKLHQDLERSAAENSDIDAQLNLYAQGADHPFKQAIKMSARFLEQKSLEDLMELARQTQTPSDDDLVKHISNIDVKTRKLRRENEKRHEKLETLFTRKEELLRLSDDFRRARYDDPASVFTPQGDLNIFLEELLRGVITGAEYWARAQSRHHWSDRPADPFRRQSSFPPFDFGGGGMRGGGSFGGGGDFTTGGGF